MTSNTHLSRSIAYCSMAKNANDTLWDIFQHGDFSDREFAKISQAILSFASETQAAVKNDPRIMQLALKEVGLLYHKAGLIWFKSTVSPTQSELDAAEFSALISCLVETVGIPRDTVLVNLIGISSDLDRKICESMIEHNLPLMAISVEDRSYEDKSPEAVNFDKVSNTVSYLVKAGSHESAIDLLEAISFMHLHEPKHWPAAAMLDVGLTFFNKAPALNDAEKARLDQFFSFIAPQEMNLFHVQGSMDAVINLAKAGYLKVAEPILSSWNCFKDQFSIDTPLAFLTEIKRHTAIDVQNLYDDFLFTSRTDASDDESLAVLLGYHLLNADTVSPSLLKFDSPILPKLISRAVDKYGIEDRSKDLTIDKKQLLTIVSEIMVQNPGGVNAMAKDPLLKEIVESTAMWPTHKLELDLGL